MKTTNRQFSLRRAAMTLLVMVLTAATAWADDTWDGGSGTPDAQYYLKLPKTGSRSFTIPTGVESFYVYDDGGYNGFYSNDCDGSLTVTAPDNCVLRVSGTIVMASRVEHDGLIVYDGADKNGTKLIETEGVVEGSIVTTLPTVTSTGQRLTFHFYSSHSGNHAGFGLKVTVIDATTDYAISGLVATGGTFVASVGGKSVMEARINDLVTLTATPESGYVLSNISVVDANNHSMNVNWTPWTNTATFTMTNSDATIVSTFTNDQTAAGGLSVNMPKTGNKPVIIPTGVKSFKVYDDGGPTGNYGYNADGYLTMTAPEGCVLQLAGNAAIERFSYLTVYDGSTASDNKLINEWGNNNGKIPTVVSSGQRMTLYFHQEGIFSGDGLDLTVTVGDSAEDHAIKGLGSVTGGTIAASIGDEGVTQAKANEVVTLTVTPDIGYLLSGISVADTDGNPIAVTWEGLFNNTATFTMPLLEVTVTPTFISDMTAAGLSINMPKTGNKSVTIPAYVQSLKVYDNGGPTGRYSGNCDGSLTMTVPEGYVLQLSGSIMTEEDWDCLTVYNGSTTSAPTLLSKVGGHDEYKDEDEYVVYTMIAIPTVVSTGQSMRLYFGSDEYTIYDGLDLTVTLVDVSTESAINLSSPTTGSTIAASVGGTSATKAKVNEQVTLTVTPESGYQVGSISVVDADSHPVIVTWEGPSSNTATFTMPGSVVTVTFSLQPIPWDGTGTKEEPYTIIYPSQLDLLAQRVNDGSGDDFAATGYKDKYFRLGANIEYTHKADNDEGADTENNYTTIGYYYLYQGASSNRYFNGDFDGQGHTVSGIRIYKPGGLSTTTGNCQGLFGFTESSANIHDVILADARITGYNATGGIVGRSYGTVSHCYVANTVAIHAVILAAWDHGGIVGENKGTVSDCISAVTLTNSVSDAQNFGGIAGDNNGGTLRRNLVIGAVVPAATYNTHGAICGRNNDGILESNYYHACNVAGVANDTDGAVSTLRDNADNSDALALVATIATAGPGKTPLDLGWGAGKYPMQLADRTLYKDGAWNTLCLPFAIANIEAEGCPLKGATVRELDEAYITGTTLTLNFKTATTAIEAGVPYIVKWETTGDNITNPVFQGVTVSSATHDYDTQSAVPAVTTEERVRFIGTYDQKTIATENKSILFLGAANTLYYPSGQGSVNIGACRAYFKIGDGNALARQLTAFNFGFDDEETTGISASLVNSEERIVNSEEWFSLDGRRLNGKPTKKGLYIVNGRKVVMK